MASNVAKPEALRRPPRPRYRCSSTTRRRILAAALDDACEKGFQRTSVAGIAARAGVSVGNINYHFGSKQKLLRETMVALIGDFRSQLLFSLPADSDDFFDQERAGLQAYLAYLRANPSHARLAEEVRLHDPDLYQRGLEAWIKEFSRRFRRGIAKGTLRAAGDDEIRIRAYLVLGAYHFLDRLIETDPYPGDPVVADAFLSMIRSGIEGPRVSAPNPPQATIHEPTRESRRVTAADHKIPTPTQRENRP